MRNIFAFSSLFLVANAAFFIASEVRADKACAGRKVALTFDDGPDTHTSPMVLHTLKKNQIPATFFVLAKNFRLYNREPAMKNFIDEVDQNELFSFANHTDTHDKPLPRLSREAVAREINALKKIPRYQEIVKKQKNEFFRAPYGATGPKGSPRCSGSFVCDEIGKAGYGGHVYWHVDPEDWNTHVRSAGEYSYTNSAGERRVCRGDEEIKRNPLCKCATCQTLLLNRTMRGLQEACADHPREEPLVVLFHDIHKNTADTLPAIIEAMKAEGVQFAPLDDIKNGNNSSWKKIPVPVINEDRAEPTHHSSLDEGNNHD